MNAVQLPMRFAFFVHSLISDWNHGNAHFLRGVCAELTDRGHQVIAYEPADAWSLVNLVEEHGRGPVKEFAQTFPRLNVRQYDRNALDLESVLQDVDVVIVHEWNDPDLVASIGSYRKTRGRFGLLFNDTHHRSVTREEEMAKYDLSGYDGVLAFGDVIRELYLERGWTPRAWTWHEAADTHLFRPIRVDKKQGDLVWIGNWGDEERTEELHEFLLEPVRALGLRARVYGVRYPEEAKQALADAGIDYAGWIPNYRVPEVFANYAVTIHVPRRPYAAQLPGIPTIRPFEAMACGIPLISAPWEDRENLFVPGEDFLTARDGDEMKQQLRRVLADPVLAQTLSARGRARILARHTCSHRVDQLLDICQSITSVPAQIAAA